MKKQATKCAERKLLESILSELCDRDASVEEVSMVIAALELLRQNEEYIAGAPRAELLKSCRFVGVSAGSVKDTDELRRLVLDLGSPLRKDQLRQALTRAGYEDVAAKVTA